MLSNKMFKKLNNTKHHKQYRFYYLYNDLTQLSYEIVFNLNKNLLFNYNYHIKTAVNILSSCI